MRVAWLHACSQPSVHSPLRQVRVSMWEREWGWVYERMRAKQIRKSEVWKCILMKLKYDPSWRFLFWPPELSRDQFHVAPFFFDELDLCFSWLPATTKTSIRQPVAGSLVRNVRQLSRLNLVYSCRAQWIRDRWRSIGKCQVVFVWERTIAR